MLKAPFETSKLVATTRAVEALIFYSSCATFLKNSKMEREGGGVGEEGG